MDCHRVRSLIYYLDYKVLRDSKILPKSLLFTKVPRGGKFPLLAKKIGYKEFGLFSERVVEHIIDSTPLEELKNYLDPAVVKYFKPSFYSEVEISVKEHFSNKTVEYQKEWISGVIAGHPDLVSEDTVYDIKTTGKFNSMRTSTIFQLLSYFCLAQKLNKPVSRIGLILPAQNLILVHDLKEWKWKPFWKALCSCIDLKNERETLYKIGQEEYMVFMSNRDRFVGGHVGKEDLPGLLSHTLPLQFFVGGRVSSNFSITKKLKEQLKSRNCKVFIHSPYIFNLSNPRGNFKNSNDSNDIPWVSEKMRTLLDIASDSNIDGVVVHCGKCGTKHGYKEAVSTMRDSVEEILAGYTGTCPLLIETSAGEKGETLCSPDELAEFWLSLSEESKNKSAICVDTCHVFAAGFNPINFIITLESHNIPISLIHFNDSRWKMGSGVDKHASIGNGYIGYEPLFNVMVWALTNKIPMVRE